jgi:predicted nucleotidyltransferase
VSTPTLLSRRGINLPMDRIVALCEKYQVEELSLFGSVLRDDFGPESDVDFLVAIRDNDYGPWTGKLLHMEEDLRELLGREVELVPKECVVKSENWIRRNHILSTAQLIYGARRSVWNIAATHAKLLVEQLEPLLPPAPH